MLKAALTEQRVSSSEISVIIQGPLYRDHPEGDLAARAIASIREHLPEAEIIVSTWLKQNIDQLNADKFILSDEPPCFVDINGNINNILRQIVSTQKGLNAANRAFTLKFRADHALLNSNITVLREYPETMSAQQRLFSKPITVTNLFVRNPLQVPMLFHLSDLVQFGRREDMLDLWSVPYPAQNDMYWESRPRVKLFGNFIGYTNMRKVTEQYLMLKWLKKHGYEIELPEVCYTNFQLLKLWEQILTNHFLVMDWQRSGIKFPERFHRVFYSKSSIYTEQNLIAARHLLASRFYGLRYVKLLFNKYVACWFYPGYLRSFASTMLFAISPRLAQRVRTIYRFFRHLFFI